MKKLTVEELVQEIENFKIQENNLDYQNFIFKKLKYNDYGFMVFGKDEYNEKNDSEVCKKLGNTLYKERYYYCEKIPNKNSKKSIIFILFNPSTACPEKRDPTIENCVNLIKKNPEYDYEYMEVLNVFSSRNPVVDKKFLKTFDNKININFIDSFLTTRTNTDVVIGWGYAKKEDYSKEIEKIKDILNKCKLNLFYISVNTKDENFINDIAKKQRHPGNQSWSALGGFKYAKLEKI